MKLIRLTTLLAACLFAVSAFTQQTSPAQNGDGGGQKHGAQTHQNMPTADEMVAQMTTRLNLTADQQTKVKAIIEETHQQARTVMNDQSLSKEDKQAKMKQMHESVQSKVNAVLTDEQKPKFDAMVKEMEAQHAHPDGDKAHK
jgi:Spy/CpxP family protein refolding chaperone